VKYLIFIVAGIAAGQSVSITSVAAVGIGDQNFAPGTSVYIYGTFPLHAAGRDFSITAGGATGPISAANSIGYISAILPFDATTGITSLFVTYRGGNSNALTVNLKPYAPEFVSGQGVPITNQGPAFPLPNYYPLSHNNGSHSPVTNVSPAAPGELLIANLTGLGQTNPPFTSNTTVGTLSPLRAAATMTLNGENVNIVREVAFGGADEVDFIVPQDAPLNLDSLVLRIAGAMSNTILVPVGSQPDVSAVLNGASFRSSGTVAAGSIVSIFGAGFGSKDNLAAFPSTVVNGISAIIGGLQAPIFALAGAAGQINVLVPTELAATGMASLTVMGAGGTSLPFPLMLAAAVPGIFFYTDPTLTSRRNAVAVSANTAWLAMPVSMAAAMGLPTNCSALGAAALCGQPVQAGGYLQIYATGLGRATPNGDPAGPVLTTGTVAPANGSLLYQTTAMPMVTIGGLNAPVLFSGIAPGYAGLYQVDVQIPAGVAAGSDVAVQISMPGSVTDSATIAVQ